MLELKNVTKKDNWIYADYYPEDWGEKGEVALNCLNLDDYRVHLSPRDEKEYKAYPYAVEALNGLRDMAEGERDLEDCVIMWY